MVVLSVEKYNQLLHNNQNLGDLTAVAEESQTQYAEVMEQQKVLVTGGAGYIGCARRQAVAKKRLSGGGVG